MSLRDQLALIRAELDGIETREAELLRRAQDLDAELNATDTVRERGQIGVARVTVGFELSDLHFRLRMVQRQLEGWNRRRAESAA